MNTYDVIVIGSGPGGYVAAIRCAQLGMKTAIIEKYNILGGTCLNVGCIPSKALLDSTEHYHNATHNFKEHGINMADVKVDMKQMITRKNSVVKQTTDGIVYLMKKNKIDTYYGHGSFKTKNIISIKTSDGKTEEIEGKKIIIATGSKPSSLPGIEIDKKRIITSTEALTLEEIPKQMVIIGGGVIGLELGSVYARVGTKVIVVEYMNSLIATMDGTMGKELLKVLKNLGIEFHLNHKVSAVKNTGKKVSVIASSNADGKEITLEGDYCLMSVGRKPYTDGLGLENIGIKVDEKGRIPVNDHLETSIPGIYAIGDVIKGAMLAHKAEEEGVFVAETMANQKPHVNYLLIPGVVYTWPEVASVGYTEEQLKVHISIYKIGSFPF
jgi:dihydrolipoamide dehydrogenase